MNEVGLLVGFGTAVLVAALLASRWQCGELQLRLAVAEHAARTDPLTGVANRAGLAHDLAGLVKSSRRPQLHLALVVIDLDGLKSINDRYGHHAGDAVLVEVARRLERTRSSAGCVARIGGDEFVVVLEPSADPRQAQRAATQEAQHLTEQIAGVRLDELPAVAISASAGAATAPVGSLTHLMIDADRAMYRAKAGAAKPTGVGGPEAADATPGEWHPRPSPPDPTEVAIRDSAGS
ncbi:GGDEF domain-containing protein [Skermania piniformis]